SGIYMGKGQSFFKTATLGQTFEHEMGHACFLAHFVGANFEWKHHDLSSPNCLLSYSYTKGIIQKDARYDIGPDNTAIEDGGWHDVVPDPVPKCKIVSGPGVIGTPCIKYGPGIARDKPCAKCILKLRGWNDKVLPCAWNHPDLF